MTLERNPTARESSILSATNPDHSQRALKAVLNSEITEQHQLYRLPIF
jgi:hypothetical protein